MKQHGLESTMQYFNIAEPTWTRQNKHSQIDDIWLLTTILYQCDKIQLIPSNEITNSDHQILKINWQFSPTIKLQHRKKHKHWIYKYNKMTKDNWEDFTYEITQQLTSMNTLETITNINELNKTWNQLSTAITLAAKKHIPRTKRSPKTYYTFSKKATKLHSALTEINKTIRHL